MTTARELLHAQLEQSCAHLTKVLDCIDEAEYCWEPVAGCWTVHDRSEKRADSADGSGRWVIDYEVPEPSPAPVTTIAWRTVHLAVVNHLYWDYAFGPATASFDLEMPGDSVTAVRWLRDSQQPLLATLAEMPSHDALDELVLTNWGERWPVNRIYTTLIREQVHHGAEIALLRDLYRNRATLRP